MMKTEKFIAQRKLFPILETFPNQPLLHCGLHQLRMVVVVLYDIYACIYSATTVCQFSCWSELCIHLEQIEPTICVSFFSGHIVIIWRTFMMLSLFSYTHCHPTTIQGPHVHQVDVCCMPKVATSVPRMPPNCEPCYLWQPAVVPRDRISTRVVFAQLAG